MICSVCGAEIKDGDKFCMACGTAVSAMSAGAAPAPEQPEVVMPEVHAPEIPEVQVNVPDSLVSVETSEPVTEQLSGGAYFTDKENEPAPVPAPEQTVYVDPMVTPAYAQPQGMPAYAQPQGQPVFTDPQGQPIYAQPQGQPVFTDPQGQPVYAQPQGIPPYGAPQGQPVYAQPQGQPVYVAPVQVLPPEAESLGKSSLILGIVGVCLALSFYFSLGGIICGAIGLSKSNEYVSKFGNTKGKALAGRLLSRGALIGGIIFTALVVLILIIYLVEEVL